MPIRFSTSLRNARLDAIEAHIGTSAVLRIFTGSPPANLAAANTGTELVAMTLPSDWMAAASSGGKALAGTWEDTAIADGVVGHFRIYASDGTTAHMQGTATGDGGGGDMEVGPTGDGGQVYTDDVITVTSFALTEGNA